MDFEGPVPVDDDITVVVHDLRSILSSEEECALQQQLDSTDSSSHEGLISRFTAAKIFVHECCSSR